MKDFPKIPDGEFVREKKIPARADGERGHSYARSFP